MDIAKTVRLNHGSHIPVVGFGTWQIPVGQAYRIVEFALEHGYEHIDTAAIYGNESDVGKAVQGYPDTYITTKLWNQDHARIDEACMESLANLGRIDLYLMHWPVNERLKSWKVMERLFKEQKVRAIGVSNFTIEHLQELLAMATVPPAVNQIEFHPFLFQKDLLEYCKTKNIIVEAYSPLARGQRMDDPVLMSIAAKYQKSVAQVMIRWALQHGCVVLPKSVNQERIIENIHVFDFSLSDEDMRSINALNENKHYCWNPLQAT